MAADMDHMREITRQKLSWVWMALVRMCCPLITVLSIVVSFAAFSSAGEPLTVAIIPSSIFPGDTNSLSLGNAATAVMGMELGQIKSLQIVPKDSIRYAFHRLHLSEGQALTASQVLQVG